MKRLVLPLFALCLGACSHAPDVLAVKQFQLRDQTRDNSSEPMVRMEKERRLRGAVSMAERKQRLGQYYTAIWNDPDGVGQGPVEVLFEYRQGQSGSLIKRETQRFPSGDGSGAAEFSVVGDNYFNHGKVISWRVTLTRGGRVLGTQRSYLWQ